MNRSPIGIKAIRKHYDKSLSVFFFALSLQTAYGYLQVPIPLECAYLLDLDYGFTISLWPRDIAIVIHLRNMYKHWYDNQTPNVFEISNRIRSMQLRKLL